MKKYEEFLIFKSIPMIIQDPFLKNVDIRRVIGLIEEKVDYNLFDSIDYIMFGDFSFLRERNFDSAFKDGVIYVDNAIEEARIVTGIIHESFHAVERRFFRELFLDGELKQEFVRKRIYLFDLLKEQSYFKNKFPGVSIDAFTEIDFEKEFDDLLYKHIGYLKLTRLIPTLFPSIYGITSISEYFAMGCEIFIEFGRIDCCPKLDEKIREVWRYLAIERGENV